ncbi:hypothetical protein MD484_g8622, partial [Candolleomyces efflorescens]
MNSEYNSDAARATLKKLLADQEGSPEGAEMLVNVQLDHLNVTAFREPDCLRLTQLVQSEVEEVHVKVVGVLCSKTLPPIDRELRAQGAKHVRKLRQFCKISGLGLPEFDSLRTKVEHVWAQFAAQAGDKLVQPVSFACHEGDYAIDVHARYFTDRQATPGSKHIPFTRDVDPLSILDDLRGSMFIHGPDNYVQYCKKVEREDGLGYRYEYLAPANLKEGDIVEATISFIAYPFGESGYKLVLALRALALLSSEEREKSLKARQESVQRRKVASFGPSGSGNGKRSARNDLVPSSQLKRRFLDVGQGPLTEFEHMKIDM